MTTSHKQLLRPEETIHILNNYKNMNMSSQQIFDYFNQPNINHDSDCIYIYRNLPEEIKKEIDIITTEQSKQNQIQIKEMNKLIENVRNFNKQEEEKLNQINIELGMYKELNRQLNDKI
jgi:hypothetical protein